MMNNERQAATLMLLKFKRQASFFAMLLLCAVFSGCSEVKEKVDMSKYKGVVLIYRHTDRRAFEPAGAYIHTFRLKDSVWTESYMYGCFANFNEGDTLK